jgi:hypothetical protein
MIRLTPCNFIFLDGCVWYFSVCFSEQLRRKCAKLSLHASSVADPDLGSDDFLTPGSGMGKKSRSGSEINIQDHTVGAKTLGRAKSLGRYTFPTHFLNL